MTQYKLINTLEVKNVLGEGVQWHQGQQAVWWTDIQNSLLYCYYVKSNKIKQYPMPERVGCFAFIDNRDELIIAFASGIALYHLTTGLVKWLTRPEQYLLGNRFNDGRVDRQGNFWAGTMVEQKSQTGAVAALYRLTCSGGNIDGQKILTDLTISNGLCWSPSGDVLYHADSPKRTIHRFDVNQLTGELTNKRFFVKTDEGCFPDGSTVDAQGYLWNAQWGGSQVVRYTPTGEVDLVIKMPVSQPTCIAFGGPELNWLIVTTAKEGLAKEQLVVEPEAGDLFIYQLEGIKGMAENVCSYTG